MPAPSVVLVPDRLDPARYVMDGIDTTETGPFYTIGEMTKFFFARSAAWYRSLESKGRLVLDGEPISVGRTNKGARVFQLEDVEHIAHALTQAGIIDARRLQVVLHLVLLQTSLHNLR